jgi:hypothetical protein
MAYSNISAVITAEDKAAVQAAIQTLKAKLPFLVNLNPQERIKLRKMGAVRTSYVQDVYQAAVNNTGVIPSDINLTEYGKDVALLKDMEDILSWLLPVTEGIEITTMAIGSELMKQSDACYGYLKVAAKKSTNQALGETVKKITDQLKHVKNQSKGNNTSTKP